MKDSIHKYFQIGTIQWMSHPPADYEVLDSIKTICCDEFFDALEVTQIKEDSVREAAGRMLEQAHMKVCYGAQPRLLGPGLNPNNVDEEGRLQAERTLLEAVDEAEMLGGKGDCLSGGKMGRKNKRSGLPATAEND